MKLLKIQSDKLILLGISAFLQVAFLNCSDVNFAEKDQALFSLENTDPNAPIVLDTPVNEEPPKKEHPSVKDDDSDDSSLDLVECELISPKQKIILSEVLQLGSNASVSRVCMSENACLQLINAYAAKRDCNISVGASSLAASEAQCTKIFPGSKGTCHNASAISDERVAQILEVMGK